MSEVTGSAAPRVGSGQSDQVFQAIFPGTSQNVAYTGTAGVVTNAFGAGTSIVRVVLTTAGFVAFGTGPTATTSDMYMAAGVPEYFGVKKGGSYKVSAVQLSSGGTMYVTEGA